MLPLQNNNRPAGAKERQMPAATLTRTRPSMRTTDQPAVGNAADLIGHTIDVDPNRIRIDASYRARHAAPDDLAVSAKLDSMRRYGQLAPIIVTPDETSPGNFRLVDGEHRLSARLWERNGHKHNPTVKIDTNATVRASVVGNTNGKATAKETGLENFAVAVRANRDANGTSPLDDMHNCAVLRNQFKADNKTTAKIIGVSEAWLVSLRALETVDPRIQAYVAQGLIPVKKAIDAADLAPELVDRIVATVTDAQRTAAASITISAKEMESEKAKAKVEAERAKVAAKAAQGAIVAARTVQPKVKSGKGRRVTSGNFRNVQEVRATFAELYTASKGFPATAPTFLNAVIDFISNKSESTAVVVAWYKMHGVALPAGSAAAKSAAKQAAAAPLRA